MAIEQAQFTSDTARSTFLATAQKAAKFATRSANDASGAIIEIDITGESADAVSTSTVQMATNLAPASASHVASSITAVDQDDGETACSRVLNLPEMVEHIMLAMEPTDVVKARRIAMIWNDTYLQSIRVWRAAVLTPDFRARCDPVRYRGGGCWTCIPLLASADLRLHPVLFNEHFLPDPNTLGTEHFAGTLLNSDLRRSLRRYAKEFITNPRCSTVLIKKTAVEQDYSKIPSIMHVLDGVRVQHLLDICKSCERGRERVGASPTATLTDQRDCSALPVAVCRWSIMHLQVSECDHSCLLARCSNASRSFTCESFQCLPI